MNSPVAWALVFHIIGVVFWIGGLLFGLQVLTMHTQTTSPEVREALAKLESKLFRGIAHPGAAITVLAGIVVVLLQPGYIHQAWLQAKLFLVAILIGLDLIATFRARSFQKGRIEMTRGECQLLHGAVSLVFIGIVIMVMIKPF